MLVGGASSYYAEGLAGDAANLIAITGYQDEESPGRALLNLMRAKAQDERVLTLNGQRVRVACKVEPYSLFGARRWGRIDGPGAKPETAHLLSRTRRCRGATGIVAIG